MKNTLLRFSLVAAIFTMISIAAAQEVDVWQNDIAVPTYTDLPDGYQKVYVISWKVPLPPPSGQKGEDVYHTSIPAAMEWCRQLRKDSPESKLWICITHEFAREFPLTEPIVFTKEFSGTAEFPTIVTMEHLPEPLWSSIRSSTPRPSSDIHSGPLWGSISLENPLNKPLVWQKWTDARNSAELQKRTSPQEKSLAESLSERIQPEVAESIWVCNLKSVGVTNYGDATTYGKRPELFFFGNRQELARYPNRNNTVYSTSISSTITSSTDTSSSSFLHSGKARGATKVETTWAGGGTKEGIFEFDGDTTILQRWKLETDLRLHGYWFWDWAEDIRKIAAIDIAETDSEKSLISMKQPYHHYGYHDNFRYTAINGLCEVDVPGEWYLDRSTELLFWLPPEKVDTTTFRYVTLSCFDAPFMVELKDVSHMVLHQLGLRESRGSAVKVENGENVILSRLWIGNMGQNGIDIRGGSNNGVSRSYLSDMGEGGIRMFGGDRKTLTPCNHFIQDTSVTRFSRLKPTYTPAVLANGCGIRIANNDFSDSGSSAMRVEGNDIMVERNWINGVVNESDDQGGVDTWYDPSYRGITLRYNFWRHIRGGTRCGAAGIRLDDIICDTTIFGNVFLRCGAVQFGAVQIHGGKDNRVTNNVMIDCEYGVSFTPWSKQRYLDAMDGDFVGKKIYEQVDIRSELFQKKYPLLATLRENANVNTISHNILVNCKKPWRNDQGIQQMEGNVILSEEGSESAILAKVLSPEFLQTHGLTPIPSLLEMGPR